MSRAIDLKLAEAEVRTWCTKHNIATSVIEPLPSGGTHLVCITGGFFPLYQFASDHESSVFARCFEPVRDFSVCRVYRISNRE